MCYQPIAIDKSAFENISSDWEGNGKSEFLKLVSKLGEFHSIVVSKDEEYQNSWERLTSELKQKFDLPVFHYYINDLLKPKYSNLNFDEIKNTPNRIENHIECTPDKLALSNSLLRKEKSWNIYSSEEFISEKYKPSNILYRIPKTIKYRHGYEFYPQVFYPYLREATKIEYFDKYLFAESELDEKLILSLVKESHSLKKMVFYAELDNIKISKFRRFQSNIKKQLRNVKIEEMRQYNSRKNHDRLIIVDGDKYSITITTSTNNFEIKGDKFIVKKPFKIFFSEGRDYND